MEERRVLQLITLILSLSSLILVCFRYHISNLKSTKRILISPIVFLVNVCAFYSYVLVENFFPSLLPISVDLSSHLWAAGLTLHSVITVIVLSYIYTKVHP